MFGQGTNIRVFILFSQFSYHIFSPPFFELIVPQEFCALKVFALLYNITNEHCIPFPLRELSYDDFLYCYGDASITDGKLALGDADEYYTIGDKYDLDLEFESLHSKYYDTFQDVFEANTLYPGGAVYRPAVLDTLLTISAADIRSTYGALTLEYSEYGPGLPVYSMKFLPGVLLVFSGWNMDDPLTDDMVPTELIITEDYSRAVQGAAIGSGIEDCTKKNILDRSVV